MNRKLLVAVVSGALALPMAAQVQADEMEVKPHSHSATYEHEHEMEDGMAPLHAHEHDAHPHEELHEHSFTIYGSVRAGVLFQNPEGDGGETWDIGSVDAGDLDSSDRLFSRIGVRASHDLGNGMTAGLHIERRLDNFRTRHQNVYLAGPLGRVTFGQQDSPYYSAVTWNGADFFGGNSDPDSRVTGVSYSSSLAGPLNFDFIVNDDGDAGTPENEDDDAGRGDDLVWAVAVEVALGSFATLSGAYEETGGTDDDAMGVSIGGEFKGLSWDIGYERRDEADDIARYGAYVGYDSEGAGIVYGEYEDKNTDSGKEENDWLVLGYKYPLGPKTWFIAQHRRPEMGADDMALVVRVDF